jgi:putative hemolysin
VLLPPVALDPVSSPPSIGLLLAALPATLVAGFGAASAAMSALSGPRKAALRETLEGRSRAALDRYIERGPQIESRWLVLRVLGIATTSALLIRELGPWLGAWSPLVAALAALLAYGVPAEILKGVVLRAPERSAPILLWLALPFELLVAPLAAPLSILGRLIGRKVMTTAQTIPPPGVTETEVEILVNQGERLGDIDHDQAEMVRNVLEFRDLTAGEAMVPRMRVTAFDIETAPRELLRQVAESGHSRYPVYRERIDNVVGMLHAKDLLSYAASHDELDLLTLETLLRRPVAFVPETREASKVLKDMRAGRHHLAVVIDEFGGMSGIVTLEDLVEEIVGDIQDEHDIDEQPIVELGEGHLMVDASVAIADLNRQLGEELPEGDDYNTVGGFLMAELGTVPAVGSQVSARGFVFHVREADERRAIKVEIERIAKPKSDSPKTNRVSAA